MPPLIASTSGSVDQTTVDAGSFRQRVPLAVPCVSSSVPRNQEVGDEKYAMCPCKCSVEGFWTVQICFDDFVGEVAMLAWMAGQRAHCELAAGLEGAYHRSSLLSRRADDGNQFLFIGRTCLSFALRVGRSFCSRWRSHLTCPRLYFLSEASRLPSTPSWASMMVPA